MRDHYEITEEFRAHLDRFWPDRAQEEFSWTRGPISQQLPEFRVRRVRPSARDQAWIYATVGAWEASGEGQHANEFILLSPREDALHVELLAMIANLHSDPRYRLGLGRVIELGRPWLGRSLADHLLVSLPLPFGPTLERCQLKEGRHIQVLWLVPITAGEAALASREGAEVLESLLERSGVDVLDPQRPTTV